MKDKSKPKNHIKMYASDEHIKKVKNLAEDEGLTQSGYLFSLTKKELKKGKK